jgi:hypothetical protein
MDEEQNENTNHQNGEGELVHREVQMYDLYADQLIENSSK